MFLKKKSCKSSQMEEELKAWGQLTAINLYGCDKELLTNPEKIKTFVLELCKTIAMKPYGEPNLQRFGEGDLEGYTLVQLIETSSITVHLDETGKRAFIDVFSCKEFDAKKALDFSQDYFKAVTASGQTIERG